MTITFTNVQRLAHTDLCIYGDTDLMNNVLSRLLNGVVDDEIQGVGVFPDDHTLPSRTVGALRLGGALGDEGEVFANPISRPNVFLDVVLRVAEVLFVHLAGLARSLRLVVAILGVHSRAVHRTIQVHGQKSHPHECLRRKGIRRRDRGGIQHVSEELRERVYQPLGWC